MNLRTNAREVFGDRAQIVKNKIVVPMAEQEYITELARMLFALDDGRDWCGEFKDGVAVFEPA